eukprot:11630391-Ditylum_brightwellii.AAC.1
MACTLAHHGNKPAKELLDSFPIDTPFVTVHANEYVPRKTSSYAGTVALMILMCHMTRFVAIESMAKQDATEFARSIITIVLHYGLSHLLITDKDSKFKGEFIQTTKLLKLQHHVAAKGNHNAIMVERFNVFLNLSLTVFNNDRSTNRTFIEGALMSAYAWNLAPVIGKDISRSLVVLGREYNFPIDFTTRDEFSFDVTPQKVASYTED